MALLPFSALGALTRPALRYEAAAVGALALAFWVSNREFERLWLRYVVVEFYLDRTAPRARPESRLLPFASALTSLHDTCVPLVSNTSQSATA